MKAAPEVNLRHVSWTCVWGRFGGKAPVPEGTEVPDRVFWTCHHPLLATLPRLLHRGECETCAYWTPVSPQAVEKAG